MDVSKLTSKRFTIIDLPDYQVELEYNKDFAIIHIPNIKITRDTYMDIKLRTEDLFEFLNTLGYSAMYAGIPHEEKMIQKLCQRCGFKHLGAHEGIEVFIYEGED